MCDIFIILTITIIQRNNDCKTCQIGLVGRGENTLIRYLILQNALWTLRPLDTFAALREQRSALTSTFAAVVDASPFPACQTRWLGWADGNSRTQTFALAKAVEKKVRLSYPARSRNQHIPVEGRSFFKSNSFQNICVFSENRDIMGKYIPFLDNCGFSGQIWENLDTFCKSEALGQIWVIWANLGKSVLLASIWILGNQISHFPRNPYIARL